MNRYFYIDSEGKQKGTFSPEELKGENIRKDTLVWAPGMNEWTRASEVAELNPIFEESAGYYSTQSPTQPVVSYDQQQKAPVSEDSNHVNAPIMSVKDWLITYLIMIIPIVNVVFLFIWAFGSNNENPNKVNWARASLIWTAIVIGLYIVLLIIIFAFIGSMAGLDDVLNRSGYEI